MLKALDWELSLEFQEKSVKIFPLVRQVEDYNYSKLMLLEGELIDIPSLETKDFIEDMSALAIENLKIKAGCKIMITQMSNDSPRTSDFSLSLPF